MNISEKSWPIGIILAILAVAGLGIWTIDVSIKNPVELDNTYFTTYRKLDMNANKIILQQKQFDKKYKLLLPKQNFKIGQNTLSIKLTDKDNNPIKNPKIEVVLTRPFTTKEDINLSLIKYEKGIFYFKPFEIKNIGRWQIQTKTTVGELTSYNKLDVNATN